MIKEQFFVPQNYEQWLEIFTLLGSTPVSMEKINDLQYASCPGVERVYLEFCKKLQDTVNEMLKRITRKCTSAVNLALNEGQFDDFEIIVRRCQREMKTCRFYNQITFLEHDYIEELDRQVVSEMKRYWKEMRKYLMDLLDESDNTGLYDMVYYLKRI